MQYAVMLSITNVEIVKNTIIVYMLVYCLDLIIAILITTLIHGVVILFRWLCDICMRLLSIERSDSEYADLDRRMAEVNKKFGNAKLHT